MQSAFVAQFPSFQNLMPPKNSGRVMFGTRLIRFSFRKNLRVSFPTILSFRVRVIVLGIACASGALCTFARASDSVAAPTTRPTALYPTRVELSLGDYVKRVLENNQSIQARLVAFHAARDQRRAEGGTFEPSWVASASYVDRQTPNTIEIERSLRSGGVFTERNDSYSTGVELRTPFGTRIRVGGDGNILHNNIQRTVIVDLEAEFQSSVNVIFEQPLLKNSGRAATMASMRLAARNSESVFQDYRRQLMLVVAESELAYRELFFAQESYRLSVESTVIARSVLADNKARSDAGRGSRLEVLEAEAGLAMRGAREGEARQALVAALNRFAAYFAVSPRKTQTQFVATEAPAPRPVEVSFDQSLEVALDMNADLQISRAQVEQEKVRLGYARNQRLPQLDLRATLGRAGLGYDWQTAWKDIANSRFPAWSMALELRIPLRGGVRERNELSAARNRLKQAELNRSDVETRITTDLDAAVSRIDASAASAAGYASVVSFRESLLADQMKASAIGRIDARTVLESEQMLFQSRLDQARSEVDHQHALLELQLLQGTLLQLRGIEIGFAELEATTTLWLRDRRAALDAFNYRAPSVVKLPGENAAPFVGDPLEGSPDAGIEPTPPRRFDRHAKQP